MKKKKINTQRLIAIFALIAMVAMFVASCVMYF